MTTPAIAAKSYASLANLTNPAGMLGKADATSATGQSFSGMLSDALGSVIEAGHKSDAQTQGLVTGKSNVIDVVTAVAETETAVSALVSVRDKVVAAYQQIMSMPI